MENVNLTAEECELIGAIIGDGFIHKSTHYRIGLVGNPIADKEYYVKLRKFINQVWNKDPEPKIHEKALRLTFNSKEIVYRLINDIGLEYNVGKCYRVKIPDVISKDWNLVKYTIRGIVDTDGSVFTADKRGSPAYPSIEITTASINLANQLRDILLARGFRVAKIWQSFSKRKVPVYRVPLNGRENLKKWVQEIGFGNPHKLRIAERAMGL